jgi:hypothetical protein
MILFILIDVVLFQSGDSKIGDFTGFISTESGFGNIGLKNGKPFLKMAFGHLDVKKTVVSGKEQPLSMD